MTTKTKMIKFTLKDFQKIFPDDDTCLDYIRYKRFPERIDCPKCGKNSLFHHDKGKKSYSCDHCGYQISPTANTIFHKSPTSLTIWFYVIYLMAQTRGGISAKQIERETGVTYKTAWRMCKQVRSALFEDGEPFDGEVEIDESYFGGKRTGKRGRGAEGKTPVVGMVERNGKLEVRKVSNTKRSTIIPLVISNVKQGSQIFTMNTPFINACLLLGSIILPSSMLTRFMSLATAIPIPSRDSGRKLKMASRAFIILFLPIIFNTI